MPSLKVVAVAAAGLAVFGMAALFSVGLQQEEPLVPLVKDDVVERYLTAQPVLFQAEHRNRRVVTVPVATATPKHGKVREVKSLGPVPDKIRFKLITNNRVEVRNLQESLSSDDLLTVANAAYQIAIDEAQSDALLRNQCFKVEPTRASVPPVEGLLFCVVGSWRSFNVCIILDHSIYPAIRDAASFRRQIVKETNAQYRREFNEKPLEERKRLYEDYTTARAEVLAAARSRKRGAIEAAMRKHQGKRLRYKVDPNTYLMR